MDIQVNKDLQDTEVILVIRVTLELEANRTPGLCRIPSNRGYTGYQGFQGYTGFQGYQVEDSEIYRLSGIYRSTGIPGISGKEGSLEGYF